MAEENKSETVSGSIDTKLLINVYGSPATGKSFTAQNITAILHENGIDCEYIAEYATELIQQGRTDELKDQITVTGEQRRREVEAFKRTNLVITDSPTALGMLYSPKEQKAEVVKFGEQSDKTPHINILLRHNAESLATFSMNGRIHGKEESLRIQSKIVAMLQGKECLHFERGMSIEKLINDIRSTQQWQHFSRSQSVEEKERTLRIAKCLQGEPVCVLNERIAPHGQGHSALRKWAKNEVFSHWNYKVISPELGEIVVDENSARDTFAHGLSPFKIEAVRAIKDVIEQGVVFTQTKIKDNDHYFIAAPVTIENQVDIVSVLVRKDMNTQRMYLHSVMVREKILEKDFEQKNTPEHTFPKADSRELSEQNRKLYSRDTGRILQNYLKVNISQLEIDLNQQIEQMKGNKMAQENENTAEQQISRQELDERLLAWSSQVVTLHKYIMSTPYDRENPIHRDFKKVRENNPIMDAPDEILTTEEKELKALQQDLFNWDNGLSSNARITLNTAQLNLIEQLHEQLQQKKLEQSQAIEKHDKTIEEYSAEQMKEIIKDLLEQRNNRMGNKHLSSDIAELMVYVKTENPTVEETQSVKNLSTVKGFIENNMQYSPYYIKTGEEEKTVEQHLSDLVDETVAIMQKHSVIEQGQVETKFGESQKVSGSLNEVESPNFQFTHKGLTDKTAVFNQQLQQLAPNQLKELQPYFEQHKAIQTLQDLYKQTGDNARLDEMQEHNRLIEWKIHNKVEAYLGKHIDYSDMNYYKGIDDNIAKMRKNGVLPDKEIEQRQPEKQSSVDEPKNFVQNQENINQSQKNATDNVNINKEEPQKDTEKPTENLVKNLSNPAVFQEQVMFATVPETQITQMIDEIAKSRTYLAVDFDNKDAAKAAGAKYDPELKGWYAEEITPELRQFLPEQPAMISGSRKPLSDFSQYAQTIGLDMSHFKEEFGKWVRVPLQGKGKNNDDGAYKLFRNDDGSIGGCAKNYSTGDSLSWTDKVAGDTQLAAKVPLSDYKANMRQKDWQTIAQNTAMQQVQDIRAATAAAAYSGLEAAKPDDPYIKNKGISDLSKLKRLDDGSTIVPLYHKGKIANLQMIPAYDSSKKRLMSQAAKVGAYYSIGNTKTPQAVIIAEGVATADSVHQIASEIYGKNQVLVLAAVDSGNLHNVAGKVVQNFPDTQKIIAADNDIANEQKPNGKNAGLVGANKVNEAYPQQFKTVVAPAINGANTDWNDRLRYDLSQNGNNTQTVQAFKERIDTNNTVAKKSATLPENNRNHNKGDNGRSL